MARWLAILLTVWTPGRTDAPPTPRPPGCVFPNKHEQQVWAMDVSPDGTWLVTASMDGTVMLWNTADGLVQAAFRAHQRTAHSVRFSPNGKRLATGGNDGAVKIWNVEPLKHLRTLAAEQSGETIGPAGYLAWLDANTIIKSDESTGAVIRVDVNTAVETPVEVMEDKPSSMPVTTNEQGTVLLAHGKRLRLLKPQPNAQYHKEEWDHPGADVRSLAISRDGTLLVSGDSDGRIVLWKDGSPIRTSIPGAINDWVWSVGFSHNGNAMFSAGDRMDVRVSKLQQRRQRLFPHPRGARSAVLSPNGDTVFTGTTDGNVRAWNTETGRQLWGPQPDEDPDRVGRCLLDVEPHHQPAECDARCAPPLVCRQQVAIYAGCFRPCKTTADCPEGTFCNGLDEMSNNNLPTQACIRNP